MREAKMDRTERIDSKFTITVEDLNILFLVSSQKVSNDTSEIHISNKGCVNWTEKECTEYLDVHKRRYRDTLEIMLAQFQSTTKKQLKEFFGFSVHVKVMFIQYCSVLNV